MAANGEQLKGLDKEMHKKFVDWFPSELPPVDEILMNVYHQFKLHDANKLIVRRQYSCPHKYCEAWHTLLQQHLNVGWIHPLVSQYMSPAFIIPKSDPSVLLWCINDYH